VVCQPGREVVHNWNECNNSAGIVIAGVRGEIYISRMRLPHPSQSTPRRSSAQASASPRIERSNLVGKFTVADIESKVRESRQFWASPEGIRRKAELERENRNRKLSPAKFPSLASKGTKPTITGADEVLASRYI
jgi:hypothetical protein